MTASSIVSGRRRARQHLTDLWGASVASLLATAADGLSFWLLVGSGLVALDGRAWIGVAAVVGALVGGIIHYTLSRFWVFRRFAAPIVGSAFLYFAMSWSAALLHGWCTGALTGYVGAGWAWFASKAILWLAWTYPMSRWVVFARWSHGGEDD